MCKRFCKHRIWMLLSTCCIDHQIYAISWSVWRLKCFGTQSIRGWSTAEVPVRLITCPDTISFTALHLSWSSKGKRMHPTVWQYFLACMVKNLYMTMEDKRSSSPEGAQVKQNVSLICSHLLENSRLRSSLLSGHYQNRCRVTSTWKLWTTVIQNLLQHCSQLRSHLHISQLCSWLRGATSWHSKPL